MKDIIINKLSDTTVEIFQVVPQVIIPEQHNLTAFTSIKDLRNKIDEIKQSIILATKSIEDTGKQKIEKIAADNAYYDGAAKQDAEKITVLEAEAIKYDSIINELIALGVQE